MPDEGAGNSAMADAEFTDMLKDARARLALRLARETGALLLRAFREGVNARNKLAGAGKAGAAGFDPVTAADGQAEALMRGLIAKHFANDAILGEEQGETAGGSGWTWVLDPIDGTRAFLCGVPTWTTLIALLRDGVPVMGIIHAPVMKLLVMGNNAACWQVEDDAARRARARDTTELSAALAGTTLPRLYWKEPGKRALLETLQERARHVQFDADALFYALLATGRMDVALDTGLQPHDAAALIPVVRGAGGVISDWRGRKQVMGGDIVAAASARLHDQLLELIAQSGALRGAASSSTGDAGEH